MIRAMLGENGKTDVNSRSCMAAVIYLGVVGPAVFIVGPGIVQGLVVYLGLTDQQAGHVVAADLWGYAIATIVMTFWSHYANWRHIFAGCLVLMVAANLVSTTVTTYEGLLAVRLVAGLGAGGVIALSFAIIGLTGNPDRNFGWLIMWVLTYGALGLLLMPTAFALGGMTSVFVFFAVFSASALPFVRFLPVSGEDRPQVEADAVNLPGGFKALALAAMFAYFLAQGAVWEYLFRIGVTAGISEQGVANALTISQFLGIAGAFTAAMLGTKLGRAGPLTLGIVAGAASLLFIMGEFEFTVYAVAIGIYNYAWNLVHPFLLAAMASFDRRGRVVVYAVAMQMVGLAIGPILAASVITEASYAYINWLGMGLFALSLALILPPVLAQSRRAVVAYG